MNPLNEAFESSIVQKLWAQTYGKTAFNLLRGSFKNLDINRIKDSDFNYLQPKDAFKINVDGLKFWINAGKIVGVTRSNTCFDKYFEVKKSRRGQIVCCDEAFLNMYSQKTKTWDGVVGCYILDVNAAISNSANINNIASQRKLARTGALALMSNRDIKKMNIERYKLMARDRSFSDGSEFNLISNVYKLLTDYIKKTSSCQLFILEIMMDGWFINYMQAYSNTLVEYIELLDKNGYTLPKNIDKDDYVWRDDNDETKLAKIRETLKKSVDNLKSQLNPSKNRYGGAIKAIVNNTKEFQDWMMLMRQSKYFNESGINTAIDFVKMVEKQLPAAFGNPNISQSIMNFELFISQLSGIASQLRNNDQARKIDDFLDSVQYFVDNYEKAKDIDPSTIYHNFGAINSSILKRCESYLKLIEKI